jgi:hypothetical protein
MNIDVDITGAYADTATFLYSLTRFPKIISVTSVQMHPDGQQDKANPQAAPTVTTNLKLTAFMFHEDGANSPGTPGSSLVQAALPAAQPPAALSSPAIPAASVGTISGAAGRAAAGAVGATKAANARGTASVGTL